METLEDVAQHYAENWEEITGLDWENTYPIEASKIDFISGAKWQEKRMYSEEDLKRAFQVGFNVGYNDEQSPSYLTFEEWFNKYKKQ